MRIPLAADLSLNGSLRGDHWRGTLAELNSRPPQALGAGRPLVSGPGSAKQQLTMGGSLPRVPEASLCVREPDSPVPGQSGFALNEFDLKRLRPGLPDNFPLAGGAVGRQARQLARQPADLHATVRTTPGTFVPLELKTDYQRLRLGIDFPAPTNPPSGSVSPRADRQHRHRSADQGSRRGRQPRRSTQDDDLKLATFAPLVPEVRSCKDVNGCPLRRYPGCPAVGES